MQIIGLPYGAYTNPDNNMQRAAPMGDRFENLCTACAAPNLAGLR
jgi:hypothetical protein